MQKIIGFILLVGVFLGGYHLGRQKDSPDLVGYAHKVAIAIATVGGDIYHSFSSAARSDEPSQAKPRTDYRQDDRAGDSRAYIDQPYESPRDSRRPDETRAEPARGASAAEAKADMDFAGKLWRAFNPPKEEDK